MSQDVARETLVALNHDMVKSSVVLQVKLKNNPSAEDSFVRGKLTTTIMTTEKKAHTLLAVMVKRLLFF